VGWLREAVLLIHRFRGPPEAQMRLLIARHDQAVSQEAPAMAKNTATLSVMPASLGAALGLALGLTPRSAGQTEAQRELVTSLESTLNARRQRIIVSQSQVNWRVKWTGVVVVRVLILLAIAFAA
jgi:hypothetical protein